MKLFYCCEVVIPVPVQGIIVKVTKCTLTLFCANEVT